jgi:hypothetical protein
MQFIKPITKTLILATVGNRQKLLKPKDVEMMMIRLNTIVFVFSLVFFGLSGLSPVHAIEGIERTELSRYNLTNVEGMEIVVSFLRLHPGA